ncbi:MAG: HAMP domain-containing histidine kinase [Microbispora sp.]|nr:HAMP domain-containing histidine kinase [Microbispora sp.]
MNLGDRFSITSRVTVYIGAMATVLCTLVAMLLMAVIHHYTRETVTREALVAGGRVAVKLERGQSPSHLTERDLRHVQVVDPSGRVVASTPDLRGRPRMAGFTPPDSRNSTIGIVCDRNSPSAECNIVASQWAHRAGQRWMVYSATPVVPPWVDPWLAGMVTAGAAALAAAITYLGYRNVRTSLRPVDVIRAELEKINEHCADRRVPVPVAGVEIREMAESVNHTLGRLATALNQARSALQQQRQLLSNASHDLRSPIAAMRAEVEDGLAAPEGTSVAELAEVLLPSLDRLQAIVHDLLTLESLDQGLRGERRRLDLSEVVAAELRTRRHPAKRIESSLEPGVFVVGDRVKLARLLTNLLDNAERHARTTITVTVRHEPADQRGRRTAVLEVLDDGPGIERDKWEVVFDRFTRLDPARSGNGGCAGLGLPIARQIAQAHGGTLRIEDSPVGARFVLRLPPAPAEAPPPAGNGTPS